MNMIKPIVGTLIDPFSSYVLNVAGAPAREYVNVSELDIGSNVLVDSDILIDRVQKLDNMNDGEIYELIAKSYNLLLDANFLKKDKHKVLIAKAFTNFRFVSILVNVIGSVELSSIQYINCNKLIYDYLTSNGRDENIENALYSLGWNNNRENIMRLKARSLDDKLATYLAIARKSSVDERLTVERVNVIIMNQSKDLMTEQMIVNIYEDLFSDTLLGLFEGIMFDPWTQEVELDENQEIIYDTINLAILDILNDMPSEMIYAVLENYATDRQMVFNSQPTRFDIHSISSDYQRILNAIEELEHFKNIKIPH